MPARITMPARILTTACLASAIAFASFTIPMAGGHSPVEKRQAAMKTVGQSTKLIGDMLKGSTNFDAAKANAALAAMRSAVASFDSHFPAGSEAADSEAGPKIWSDSAGFKSILAKFQSDLGSAVATNAQDKAGIGAVFGQVAQNCKTCHQSYRVKKN